MSTAEVISSPSTDPASARSEGDPARPGAGSLAPGSARAVTATKRALDVVVASVLLVATAPVVLVLFILVRLDGGPAFFKQRRVGQGGRVIEISKFRSMAVDAETRLHADPELYAKYLVNGFKLPADEDPRLSQWGRFLRSSSLDELPQLISVLKGDMSMVGPRPIVEAELVEYASRQAQEAYLSARPGLTGLWQVSGRSSLNYQQRVELDLAYLARPSVGADLWILVKTALVVLRRVGAH
ncbi:MAG TPA: sugar transferase [Acidimicrobiales bacterium]|nr:sugar transferase [Acidimicrobiales bacterium]